MSHDNTGEDEREYTVTWTVEVSAKDPTSAAAVARLYQDAETTALVFRVIDKLTRQTTKVDLMTLTHCPGCNWPRDAVEKTLTCRLGSGCLCGRRATA